jgi:hypothetical protein
LEDLQHLEAGNNFMISYTGDRIPSFKQEIDDFKKINCLMKIMKISSTKNQIPNKSQ